ncbi:hypothetical protein KP509_28G009100 [Ceratopteris richardii]|nr:hypothetical protein KP509_28G009100 [Ceratopteris richardii]
MPLKVTQVYQRRTRNLYTEGHVSPTAMDEHILKPSTQNPVKGTQETNIVRNGEDLNSLCIPRFKVGDFVWAKTHTRQGAEWPGMIVDRSLARRNGYIAHPDYFYVRFFGNSQLRAKDRSLHWVHKHDIRVFTNEPACSNWHRYTGDFCSAISEARQEMQKCEQRLENSKRFLDAKQEVQKRNQRVENIRRFSVPNDQESHIHNTDSIAESRKAESLAGTSSIVPTSINVICFGVDGAYYPRLHEVICLCPSCKGCTPLVSLSKWEAHTGCRQKKWKLSVKLKDSSQMLISWLESMIDNGAMDLGFQAHSQEQVLRGLLQVPYVPVTLKWTPEKCAVCGWVEDYEYNQILVCNRCQIGVHEECYGVKASETGGSFICRACESSEKDKECCLCPVRGGALKPSVIPDLWVHVYCAWFMKGIFFRDISKMEPAEGILSMDMSKFKQQCVICKQYHGACIGCWECDTTFHATCALRAGYRMELSTIMGQDELKKVSYCARHRKPSESGRLVIAALEAEMLLQEKLRRERVEAEIRREKLRKQMQQEYSMVTTSNDDEDDSLRPFQLMNHDSEKECTIGPDDEYSRLTCSRLYAYRGPSCHRGGFKESVPNMPAGYTRHERKEILRLRQHPGVHEFLSNEERLMNLKKTQNSRICFGKSAIHKWGLFARQDIQEGDWVVEYLGEIVRQSVADIRERRYKQQGKDCYLFKVSDEIVIDATHKGNIARLINHSCAPNCFARILTVKRPVNTCIILIAKQNVKAGEELTYDYLFDPENQTVPCLCRAPNCRKFIC